MVFIVVTELVKYAGKMTGQIPLLAELSNCLSAYAETFERIMSCVESACDSDHKTNETPILIQIQDLLVIDGELKMNLKRMDQWRKRQNEIEKLEKELAKLSGRINNFAKTLSSSEAALQNCISIANKLQKGVAQRQQTTSIEEIFNTAKLIGPAASGAWRTDLTYPWMPDTQEMQSGAIKTETVAVAAPNITAHTVTNVPVETKREFVMPDEYESSSSEESNE